MKFTIEKLLDQESLTQKEAREVMFQIMSGNMMMQRLQGFLSHFAPKAKHLQKLPVLRRPCGTR